MIGDPPAVAWAAKWLGISEEAAAAMPRAVQLAAAQRTATPPPAWLRQAISEITPGAPGEAVRLWRLLVSTYPALSATDVRRWEAIEAAVREWIAADEAGDQGRCQQAVIGLRFVVSDEWITMHDVAPRDEPHDH